MYGTDLVTYEKDNPDSIQQKAHNLWMTHWTYFTTGDTLQSRQVNGVFKGLMLPKEVDDKIYNKNISRWFDKQ